MEDGKLRTDQHVHYSAITSVVCCVERIKCFVDFAAKGIDLCNLYGPRI